MSRDERYRVLAADDDPVILKAYRTLLNPSRNSDSTLQQLLQQSGGGAPAAADSDDLAIELVTVEQGEEAVDVVRQSIAADDPFAVVLMDVRMPPGIDGIEAARQIQEIDRELFLVIVTAYSDYSLEMAEGILRGNFTMLRKPFENSEITEVVKGNIKSWKLNRKFASQFMR